MDSFTELTGETTASFPAGMDIDDPAILRFVELLDGDGNVIDPNSDAADTSVISATRASTLAARLQAMYGSVDEVDAFVGMVSEPHVAGTEMGELQLAIWEAQFSALRDGDRFFYGNDDLLEAILDEYGIDYRRSLANVIGDNSDGDDIQQAAFIIVPETGDDEGEGDEAGEAGEAGEQDHEDDQDGPRDGRRRRGEGPPRLGQGNDDPPPPGRGGRRGGRPRT